MTHPEILVVEDNPEMARGLRTNMAFEGYRVTLAKSGPEALDAVRGRTPDPMVLDLMLPGLRDRLVEGNPQR